jgi:Domain of Unknown Function (DUF326)
MELTPPCSAESGPCGGPASFDVYKYGHRTPGRDRRRPVPLQIRRAKPGLHAVGAEHHEHCRVCSRACSRCEQACNDLLAALD